MKDFANKIYNSILEKKFILLYILVFVIFCAIYNFDNQNLNYFLKRGVILEYSQDKNIVNDIENIREELLRQGIYYSSIKEIDKFSINEYDNDNKIIEKKLFVALPFLPNKNKEELFNSVSNYIFEKTPKTKLIDIKTMNDRYQNPYSGILKFLLIASVSFFIWVILTFFILGKKQFLCNFFNFFNFFEKQENAIETFYLNTKEKGAKYFFKKILFDECDDDKEVDFTKEIINTIVFVLVCVVLIRVFIGELRWIPSGSMIPTFLAGDRVFVEKINFPKKEVKRGDILVFYPPEQMLDKDIYANMKTSVGGFIGGAFRLACRYIGIPNRKDMAYIKRVVGMPGDKFEIKYNEKIDEFRVFINDAPLNEPYIKFNEYFLLNEPQEYSKNGYIAYKKSQSAWTPCFETGAKYCGPFVIPEKNYFMMGDNRGNSQDSRFWGTLKEDRIIGRANFLFFPFKRVNILRDKYLELNEQKTNYGYAKKMYIVNRYELM